MASGSAQQAVLPGVPPLLDTTMAQSLDSPQFLTPDEVVEFLRISMRTLERWREKRRGPPLVRLSRNMVRYSWPALVGWLGARTEGQR